jgi:hypothetical protein
VADRERFERYQGSRTATIVTPDHVEARALGRTRRVRWPDIQEIRVEGRPSRHMWRPMLNEHAVLYDRLGRRIRLPHMNDANLRRCRGRSLHHEIRQLRDTWLQLRGDGWTRVPGIAELIADWQCQGSVLTAGIRWALLGAAGAAVIVACGPFDAGGLLLAVPALTYLDVSLAIALAVARRRRLLRARLAPPGRPEAGLPG